MYFFPVTKLSHLSESFLIIGPFGFYITFVSNFQLPPVIYNIWIVTTFRFFIKSPEEGRFDRPKYR